MWRKNAVPNVRSTWKWPKSKFPPCRCFGRLSLRPPSVSVFSQRKASSFRLKSGHCLGRWTEDSIAMIAIIFGLSTFIVPKSLPISDRLHLRGACEKDVRPKREFEGVSLPPRRYCRDVMHCCDYSTMSDCKWPSTQSILILRNNPIMSICSTFHKARPRKDDK